MCEWEARTEAIQDKAPRKLKKNQLLVTMDYVGPMQVNVFDGYNGLVNIMVEPFHLELVYPLKSKTSEAQLVALKDCIKRLKVLLPDHRVAFLKTDNAREYAEGKIAAYCDDAEIVQEFSAPYAPQQNGKIERGNRVVVEMARAMTNGANLPKQYWRGKLNTSFNTTSSSTTATTKSTSDSLHSASRLLHHLTVNTSTVC